MPRRRLATEQTAFHVRVMLSIGVMFRTPSVRPATGSASVPFNVS